MAALKHNLILALACASALIYGITCKPVKRSATDCYGTDCIIPQDELDFRGNPRDTVLLENITGSLNHAFPEFVDLLKNIAYIHQNATVTALPSIAHSLENITATATATLLTLKRVADLLEDQAGRQNQDIVASISPLPTVHQQEKTPDSCLGLSSGQHTILPNNTELGLFPVVCDMDTDGGGWIVFQRRFNGSVDFDRTWNDYETGFGSLDGEFWLGLRKLHVLTSLGRWELRVDLGDFDGNRVYAIYDDFRIGDHASFYRLDIGSYSGTAGDSISRSGGHTLNGMAFTTKDQDHDLKGSGNCAIVYHGAWWYRYCGSANLNGLYMGPTGFTSMAWYYWKYSWEPLKESELKIRLTDG